MVVVLTSFGSREKALEVAHILVEERLAACVNVLGEARSVYRWNGEVESEDEVLCLMKTTQDGFEALRARLVALHPYEVPEVIALPVSSAHPAYFEWLISSVRSTPPAPK